MKTTPKPNPEDRDQYLDTVLSAPLRSTTPGFDRRFDEMRRRLANEKPASLWRRWWSGHEIGGLRVAIATAAMVAIVTVLAFRNARSVSPELIDTAAFLELVALEESLSPALALTDPEALEVLLHMPLI